MGYKQYCKDYEKIENYEKAKKDDFKGWHCHHRLETHNSDGERRLVDITVAELQALRMYYNRPPEELIFLTTREHNAFKKGKRHTEETRRKMSEAQKGNKNALGCKRSEETRKKISEAKKGKHRSDETRRKMKGHKNALGYKHSEEAKKKIGKAMKGNTNTKGMHWFNNGKINTMAKECPEGFTPGCLRK